MELIQFKFENNAIKVNVNSPIENIIPEDEFPLKFKVQEWINEETIWECDLYSGHWATYPDLNFKNFSIYTKSGKLIKNHKFSPYESVGTIEEFFNLWIGTRNNTNGLVLGAGTGTWGEWVNHTVDGNCNVVLVEGDPNNIPKLVYHHLPRKNVKIVPVVVSPNGGKVKFWVAPEGLVSSLDVDNVKKFLPDSNPEYIEVESKSIMDIIKNDCPEDLNWVRIDIEGTDYDVIMRIDDSVLQKISMIIYENMNINGIQILQINEKLNKNGFKHIYVYGIDTVCVK